jgi:membrane-bound lytic murein transglycosylase F
MGIKVIGERTRQVDFSKPLLQTRQVLVQRLPDNWRRMRTTAEVQQHLIRNPLDLAGKMVYVPRHSAYSLRLRNLQEEMGDSIVVVEFPQSDEKLIEMVARGEIDYTVCDEHVAAVNKKYFPDIDVETALSFPQNVAWAMKKRDNALKQNLDEWLETFTKGRVAQHIYNKYFVNPRSMQYAHKYHSVRSGRISVWDDILKQKTEELGWDWRLVASLMYQESRFQSDAISWMGAQGLMQLMPGTAIIYGVDSLSSPVENINAGIKYLKMLDDRFKDIVHDPDERIKFVLASYNAGIAHVFDARRLAEKYGRDPNLWDDNVDFFLLNKSNPKYYNDEVVFYGYCRGEESFNYVNDIMERFEHYRNVIPG